MKRKVKNGFYAGICCGLVMFASIPHAAFALPMTIQAEGTGEIQKEISYLPNARMEEVPPSLLEEENPSADLEESPRANGIEYRIGSDTDWQDLLSGAMDSNWTGGSYTGVENVTIILDGNVITDQNLINLTQDNITFTLDLNGNSFQVNESTGSMLTVKSIDAVTGMGKSANTFILCNGTMAATGINTVHTIKNLDIQNIDFVDMNTDAVSGSHSTACVIQNCTFSHIQGGNLNTAIDTSYSGTSGLAVQISNITISGFQNGIDCSYNSGTELKNITVSGANIGFDLSSSRNSKVVNTVLTGNKASDSWGIVCTSMTSSINLQDFLQNGLSDFSQVTISDFDSGIRTTGAGILSFDNCKITNVNQGLNSQGGSTHFNVRDSILTANSSIAEGSYSGDSYGIYAATTGFVCVNTEVTGFKIGAYNSSSASTVANCTFDNLEYNIDAFSGGIYNSVLKNADVGFHINGATAVIVDTEIIGKNTTGSTGILASAASAVVHVMGTASFAPDGLNSNLDTLINYVKSQYPDASHHDMIVSGYDTGLQCNGNQIQIADIEVENCNTGMKGTTFWGYIPGGVKQFSNNYIHDCEYGVDCDSFNLQSNLFIYNCDQTGMQIHNQLTTPHLLEIYSCKDGLIFDGNVLTGLHLRIHDNDGNGLAYTGNKSSAMINCSMEIYNNGGWNVCGNDIPMFHLAFDGNNEFTCRLENGGLGNMNINLKGASGTNFMLTSSLLKSGAGVYYVYPGKEICIGPHSDPSWTDGTDWLEGCMVFDIENYTEGAVAAYVPEGNIRTVLDQQNDTWNFVRTHFFAAKEGWVIRYDESAAPGTTGMPLVFVEGCNVTYDYETNGGTSMSENYAKMTYQDGDAVDLSLTASRPGYEFIGWNTDPDAHEAISALTVQKKDITLYAIYRKTVTFTYHTYDPALDYTQSGYIFNKEALPYADQAGSQMANALSYADRVPQSVYNYAGYSYDGRDTTALFRDGEILSAEKTDIYCVYTMNGELRYLGPDGTLNDQQKIEAFYTILDTLPYQFSYVLKSFQAEKGYVFGGWRAADGMIYAPGSIYVTTLTSAELQAEVNAIMVSALVVSPKHSTIGTGDTLQMSVSILPEDALNPTVTWTTSDASIASIDENGLVTAHAEGTVTITASANDGSGCSDTAVVVVVKEKEGTTSLTPKTGDNVPILPVLLLGCLALLSVGYECLEIRKRYRKK